MYYLGLYGILLYLLLSLLHSGTGHSHGLTVVPWPRNIVLTVMLCNCHSCGFQTLVFFREKNTINLSKGSHLVSDPLSFPGSSATPGITTSTRSLCYFSLKFFICSCCWCLNKGPRWVVKSFQSFSKIFAHWQIVYQPFLFHPSCHVNV